MLREGKSVYAGDNDQKQERNESPFSCHCHSQSVNVSVTVRSPDASSVTPGRAENLYMIR
jgi:hypothetical protein